MVIDDDDCFLHLVEELLKYENVRPILATNGHDGIKQLNEKPCLIILDYLMPGMDGIETKRKIREVLGDVPIILCSASCMIEDLSKDGFDGYLRKPFGIEDLVGLVNRFL